MQHEEQEHDNGQALLLTAGEAAKLLNVSEKTLWNHTAPRGNQIPVVRLGKTLRYSPDALKQWIAQQLSGQPEVAKG